jgi:hypothetical protein
VKEPASARSVCGPLMVGPDNALYVIAKNDPAANQTAWPAGPASSGTSAAQDIHVRHGLRRRLGHLPQMGNAGPC